MNVNDNYQHYVTIVAGENPEKQMERFDSKKRMDKPIVVFKLSDAERLRKAGIAANKSLIEVSYPQWKEKNIENADEEYEYLKNELEMAENSSDIEYFYYITDGLEYDPETGDAVSYMNPDGKWAKYAIGKVFSVPFLLKDGTTAFQARKRDVDWEKIHMSNQDVYKSAWEVVVDGRKPENEEEEIIYENMKNRGAYFDKFGTKENYVMSCTAFWGYAFLKDDEWTELDCDKDQFEWMKNFYSRFIEPLPDDTLLTIFECFTE